MERRRAITTLLSLGLNAAIKPSVVGAEIDYMPSIHPEPSADGSVLIPDFYNQNELYQCFPSGQILEGLVTIYSYDGCLGCNGKRQMANGQILNDRLLTIACNRVAIPSPVKITNLETGLWTYALATDTGGFGGGIIADLTPATSYALGARTFSRIIIEEQHFDKLTLDNL